MKDYINELYNKGIKSENVLINEPMKKHTSFKIGGPADAFVKATTIQEIKATLEVAKKYNVPLYIIGNGTNLLVKDEGYRGIILKPNLKNIIIEKNSDDVIIKAECGVPMGMLAQKLMNEEIAGFEELAGIPGTIGGAIRMNAGANGKEIKDVVEKTLYLDRQGNEHTIYNNEHQFEYRSSMFTKKDYIIIETTINLKKGKKEEIKAKMDEYANWRKEKQPLEFPCAGSTFKRGKDFITAQLIDQAGLKGYTIGGAQVSEKHAGFVINIGEATAQDVIELTNYIKEQVYKKFEKKIELEIEVI